MNNRMYLVTGAAGFLGSHVCSELLERGDRVRALVLPRDPGAKFIPASVEVVEGNLCDMASLEPFFAVPEGTETYVIHCASMVTTNPDFNQKLIDVNVGGTKNIIELCLSHPECKKLVYVSSTGAIPELPKGTKIAETRKFTPINPKTQVGCYSQSKAMATQEVLDACDNRGLQACVVHPSGILGPDDHAISETTDTVIKIMNGEMSVWRFFNITQTKHKHLSNNPAVFYCQKTKTPMTNRRDALSWKISKSATPTKTPPNCWGNFPLSILLLSLPTWRRRFRIVCSMALKTGTGALPLG